MHAAAKEALSHMLFFDEATPIETLARSFWNEPWHMSAEAAAELSCKGGPIALWPEKDGCALLAFDLHSLVRDAGLPDKGLVLRLPSSIAGAPLVRIAAEAFRPWLSYGANLRLLALPESMREISDEALSPLCFEHAALPSTLRRFGKRNVKWNKLTAYPDRVRFLAHPENTEFSARDGALYGEKGSLLIAQAYPYEGAVRIEDGVRFIRDDAFMHTPRPPKAILCPNSLEEAPDAVDEAVLWVRDENSPFAETLRREGRRAVSPAYRIIDGRVYDFDEEGAVLVAIDAADDAARTPLPETIGGAPLVRIARRAMPTGDCACTFPASVQTIEDGNACSGATAVALGENVASIGKGCFTRIEGSDPVRIPRSVQHIGARSFASSLVRFESLDTAVFIPSGAHDLFANTAYSPTEDRRAIVQMKADPNDEDDEGNGFASVFRDALPKSGMTPVDAMNPEDEAGAPFRVPFDMAAYDARLANEKSFFGKTRAMIERLAGKVELSDEYAKRIAAQLGKNADAAMALAAQTHGKRAIERLAQTGFYETEERFAAQCELLRRARKTEALGWLMEWRARNAETEAPAKPSDRFSF